MLPHRIAVDIKLDSAYQVVGTIITQQMVVDSITDSLMKKELLEPEWHHS